MKRIALLLLLLAAPLARAQSDLVLSVRPLRTEEYGGNYLILYTTVRNAGPQRTKNLVMTIDAAEGVLFNRTFPAFACSDTRPIRCRLDDFGPNFDQHVEVSAYAPQANGEFPVTISVASDNTDPTPANNTVVTTFKITLATAFRTDLGVPVRRVDPGSVATTSLKLVNNVRSTPARPRLELEAVNATIETIETPAGWSCTARANGADCALPPLDPQCFCSGTAKVTTRMNADRGGGEARLLVRAASELPNTGTGLTTLSFQLYRLLSVTTIADAGPGSLREAITAGNECGDTPCKIVFELDPPVPAEGWFTIVPATPLPAITAARMVVYGTSQTARTGDTNPRGPEIALDGRLAGEGLVMHSDCEAVVEGLAIGNFTETEGLRYRAAPEGIRCGNDRVDRYFVARNHIGVDPTGTVAWPNLRGIRADDNRPVDLLSGPSIHANVISGNLRSGIWMWRSAIRVSNNRIGVAADGVTPMPNGASGVFLGPQVSYADIVNNVIANHPEMGVAVARGAASFEIRENSMRNNGGLGIDQGLDGPDAAGSPVLLSAVYDPAKNQTVISGRIDSRPSIGHGLMIDIYANDGPDGDGERHLVTGGGPVTGTFTVSVWGDYSGQWINATMMRFQEVFARPPDVTANVIGLGKVTSELSNSVLVGR